MNKYLMVTVLFVFARHESSAQVSTNLIAQKFDTYQSAWPKTKLHLVFNQDKYAAGDTAFFKAYTLDENLIGVPGKQLIELSLSDSEGQTKLHITFNVNNGLGQNQLVIPDTLSAGIYLLVAHSNWMKNFDPAFFFKNEIVIVKSNAIVPTPSPMIKVTAEGGHLISGVDNKIIIRTDMPGSVVQIIDSVGEEKAHTTTDMKGMASIIFEPKLRALYFALLAGGSFKGALPPTEDDGLALIFDPLVSGKIILRSPSGSALAGEELYLILSSRGKILYKETFMHGTDGATEQIIPKEGLPEGLAHISVLHKSGKLLASRDFYNAVESKINPLVTINKSNYQTREKVSLEVSLTDDKGDPLAGEFSISVLNAHLFETEKQNTLSDELTIFGGIKERILIDRSTVQGLTVLDNFLISATEPLPWKAILAKELLGPRYPITGTIEKGGKAYFSDTLEPVPDGTQLMFYFQNDRTHYLSLTRDKGKFGLAVFDFFGMDELFYSAQSKGQELRNLKIQWEDDSVNLPRSSNAKETKDVDCYAAFVRNKKLIDQSFEMYSSSDKIQEVQGTEFESFEDLIGRADVSTNVQDYILFPSMVDFIKEVLPSVYHRKIGQLDIVRVKNLTTIATADPVYIIDGRATRNTAFFLSLKLADLLTIKIVYDLKKLAPLRIMGKNGIIVVQTKKGDARALLDDPTKIIQGLNEPIVFNQSDFNNSQIPYFKSTIYWNPSIKINANARALVEFFCTDDVGKMTIRIDGMATGGRAFTVEKGFEIDSKIR